MRLRVFVLVVVTAMGALGTAGTSWAAASSSSATCTVNAGVKIKPGISQTPSKGTIVSKKHSTIECVGTVNDVQVNGSGPISFTGTYGSNGGDTCSQGSGAGKFTAKVPKMNGGSLSVKGRFTFTRAGSQVVLQGTIKGGSAAQGTLEFVPDAGQDCVVTPVKSATVAGDVSITG
jgi:hypothetical protein